MFSSKRVRIDSKAKITVFKGRKHYGWFTTQDSADQWIAYWTRKGL